MICIHKFLFISYLSNLSFDISKIVFNLAPTIKRRRKNISTLKSTRWDGVNVDIWICHVLLHNQKFYCKMFITMSYGILKHESGNVVYYTSDSASKKS